MEYLEINFSFSIPNVDFQDVFVQELADIGFDSFVEVEDGLQAFVDQKKYSEKELQDLIVRFKQLGEISFNKKEIPFENWNSQWEKNFNPIEFEKKCRIRATFHSSDPSFDTEIIIDPKMSFGTGHHETTFQMVQYLFEIDCKNKYVLDMGCGTGILAILASIKGANAVDAIDIDPICVENSIENVQLNSISNILVSEGTAETIGDKKYDILIANINRNILLADMNTYSKCLRNNGILLLSGFYLEDLEAIKLECLKNKLSFINHKTKNNWVAAQFILN